MKNLSLLFLLLLTLFACRKESGQGSEAPIVCDAQAYFPQSEGSLWDYAYIYSDSSRYPDTLGVSSIIRIKVKGDTIIGGFNYTVKKRGEINFPSYDYYYYDRSFTRIDDNEVIVLYYDGWLSGGNSNYHQERLLYPMCATKGFIHSSQTAATNMIPTIAGIYKVVIELEERLPVLETAYFTFNDVLVFKTTFMTYIDSTGETNSEKYSREWIAKGVGLVRTQPSDNDGSYYLELTNYDVK